MSTLSRRAILSSGVAGGLFTAAAAVAADGTFGNPDQPPRVLSTVPKNRPDVSRSDEA